jgi:hypothetical protein
MRFRSILAAASLAAASLSAAIATPSFAQSTEPLAPQRQFNIDGSAVGLSVGFAARSSDKTSFGVAFGIGGNWYNYMVLAGGHFAEENGLSYETRDGSTSKSLYELGHATVFVRRHFDGGRQLDLGLKVSGFLHSDSSDDDPGGGTFVGLSATAMWYQWKKLRVGSELDVGRYSEGRPEIGVNVAPLLLRVTFP